MFQRLYEIRISPKHVKLVGVTDLSVTICFRGPMVCPAAILNKKKPEGTRRTTTSRKFILGQIHICIRSIISQRAENLKIFQFLNQLFDFWSIFRFLVNFRSIFGPICKCIKSLFSHFLGNFFLLF
jgi:hypothetical protein